MEWRSDDKRGSIFHEHKNVFRHTGGKRSVSYWNWTEVYEKHGESGILHGSLKTVDDF